MVMRTGNGKLPNAEQRAFVRDRRRLRGRLNRDYNAAITRAEQMQFAAADRFAKATLILGRTRVIRMAENAAAACIGAGLGGYVTYLIFG